MTVLGVPIVLDGQLALAALAVFAGGLLRGFAGFGSALVMVPVLALVFGPRAAVVMHAIVEIPVIASLLPSAIRDSRAATIRPMLVALAVTTPLGALALKLADPELMKLAISVVVLVMVGVIAAGGRLAFLAGTRGAALGGAVGGLIQGSTGVGGPPVAAALLARGEPAAATRANVVAVMSAMIGLSLGIFALYGLIDRQALVIGLLAAPVCVLGTWAGSAAFARGGGRGHRAVALGMIAITATATTAGSVGALLGRG